VQGATLYINIDCTLHLSKRQIINGIFQEINFLFWNSVYIQTNPVN